MSAHRIQLRGPWQLEWQSGGGPFAQKVRLPAEWDELFSGHGGRVCLTRKFHRPTNLGPNEQVDLVFDQWPGVWTIRLNQQTVGQFGDAAPECSKRITITPLLRPTNELTVETQIEQTGNVHAAYGLMGQVALEIHTGEDKSPEP
jgi:hypothetical protein